MSEPWRIDHDNLETRTWVCTKCGCQCLSKSPWQRSVIGASTGGLGGAMNLNILANMISVKRVEAWPARPKERVMQMGWSGDATFCELHREQDIGIFLDPGNHVDTSATGVKPLQTTGDRLMQFFKFLRQIDEETLRAFCCDQDGGHSWTDDPAEIARWGKHQGEAAEGASAASAA